MWEQRYGILCPQRSCTNIRLYSDCELKTLLNISLLNEHGLKISKIARLTPEVLAQEVMQITGTCKDYPMQLGALVLAMVELDEDRFSKVFNASVQQVGIEQTMTQMVYPFLERIGILWQTGNINPAQEHFVSLMVRQKLIAEVDKFPVRNDGSVPRYLLFLPEGELHEISLTLQNLIIRARGGHVLYLGQSLPYCDLLAAARVYQPHFISTVFTSRPDREQVQEVLNKLHKDLPETAIYVSGNLVKDPNLDLPDNIWRPCGPSCFISLIEQNNRHFFRKSA